MSCGLKGCAQSLAENTAYKHTYIMAHVREVGDIVLSEKKFGFKLKREQSETITAIISGRDTMSILPTGYGKSVCYWLPPLILKKMHPEKEHSSLVISPLKTIMNEQATYLRSHGISAFAIYDGMSHEETEAIKDGSATVIFSSPEAILLDHWRAVIDEVYKERLCLVGYDEAHCISEWGLDFREDYRKVCILQSILDCPVLALTATATQDIIDDVTKLMGLKDLNVISCLPQRPNIHICMCTCSEDYQEELAWLLDTVVKQGKNMNKVIVYVSSISACESIYIWLHSCLKENAYAGEVHVDNRIVEMFHAHTDVASKERIMSEFNKSVGSLRILIATVAVGMGVDIRDISVVVIWGLPSTYLQLWQECGRAGRDGRNSIAICYAYPRSKSQACAKCRKNKSFICSCEDRVHLRKLTETTECQRMHILEYFALTEDNIAELHTLRTSHQDGEHQCVDMCGCKLCSCCISCMCKCSCSKKCSSRNELILQYV